MEGDPDFGEEDFKVLPAQTLSCGISNFLQGFTTGQTRICVHSGEREIIISRIEIIALLLCKLSR